jgi:hypothetical protein
MVILKYPIHSDSSINVITFDKTNPKLSEAKSSDLSCEASAKQEALAKEDKPKRRPSVPAWLSFTPARRDDLDFPFCQNKANRHPKVSFRPSSRNPVCFTKRTQNLSRRSLGADGCKTNPFPLCGPRSPEPVPDPIRDGKKNKTKPNTAFSTKYRRLPVANTKNKAKFGYNNHEKTKRTQNRPHSACRSGLRSGIQFYKTKPISCLSCQKMKNAKQSHLVLRNNFLYNFSAYVPKDASLSLILSDCFI